jgi:hypothetical protein
MGCRCDGPVRHYVTGWRRGEPVDKEHPSRMSGWKRIAILIGVILSIAWIGVMLARSSQHMLALRLAIADEAKKSCEKKNETDCSQVWIPAYFEAQKRDDDLPTRLKPGIVEAFVPVLAGWLIAYGIILAMRWVAEGFRLDRR